MRQRMIAFRSALLLAALALSTEAPANAAYELVADLVPTAAPQAHGGPWTLAGSLGEPAAGTLTGGAWTLRLGFWPIFLETSGVPESVAAPAPDRFALDQNRPNPFNPETRFSFSLPESGGPVRVRLAVYDPQGRLVRVLLDEIQSPGVHDLTWDGRDDRGHSLPSGVYFARLDAAGLAATKQLVLMK